MLLQLDEDNKSKWAGIFYLETSLRFVSSSALVTADLLQVI